MAFRTISPDQLAWTARPHEQGEPARYVAELSEMAGFAHTRANVWRYEPGAHGRRHRHPYQEETFVVLQGTLTMYVGEPPERVEVQRGGLIHIDAKTPLQTVNDGTTDLLVYVYGYPPEDEHAEILDPTSTETHGITTKISPRSVSETADRLTEILAEKGLKVFAVIDQQAEARQAGLDLRETILVIFGSPAAGTPVMAAAPLAALELPLKVLVWADDQQTKVSYLGPDRLAARYCLAPGLAAKLAGIDSLTDQLISP